jgi:division/cell wall cluster transcriptional repressor MraZ
MFMGEFTHAIDDKGRLTIPARFREELAYGSVITRGYDKYLLLYTADVFKRIITRAEALSCCCTPPTSSSALSRAPKLSPPPTPIIARCCA